MNKQDFKVNKFLNTHLTDYYVDLRNRLWNYQCDNFKTDTDIARSIGSTPLTVTKFLKSRKCSFETALKIEEFLRRNYS